MSRPIGATGTPTPTTAFFTVTYVEVIPDAAADAAHILQRPGIISPEQSGEASTLGQRRDRPNQFVVLTHLTGQEELDRHLTAEPVTRIDSALARILLCPSDLRQHSLLAALPRIKGDHGLMVVTHVDVVPQFRDDGEEALRDLIEATGARPGCHRFEVWQQINRPNHFTLVEEWSTQADFDAHVASEAARHFRTRLVPVTGALYDERLYVELT